MPFSKDVIKNLLSVLERKYPATYEDVDTLKKEAPPAINPSELFKNLLFCREEGFIECSPITEGTSIVGLKYIKITSKGIRFLRDF